MAARSTLDIVIKTRKTGRGTQQAVSDLKKFGAALGAVGAAAAAAKVAFDFSKEGAQLARLQDASAAMAAQFGQDMDAIVDAMALASNNTVSRMDLMGAASKALQLGVAKTPEEFAKLAKASIALGRAMGRGPVDAINDITTGIGRMSPLILDNLGIMTKGMPQGLSDLEKKQWLYNKAIEASIPLLDEQGNLIQDTATSYDQLSASLDDVTAELKMLAADTLAPGLVELLRWIKLNREAEAAMDFLGNSVGMTRRELKKMELEELVNLSDALQRAKTPTEEAAAGLHALGDAGRDAGDGVRSARQQLKGYLDFIEDRKNDLLFAMHLKTSGTFGARGGRGEQAGYQHGGTFDPFSPILVGERGPEMMIPGFGGQIVNNKVTNNITATINNRTEGAAFEAFLRSLQ